MVSHAFKKAFTDEDHKLSSDEHNSGIIWKKETVSHSSWQTIQFNYVCLYNYLLSHSVQRVFRLAGTVSKKNDETISQEILVGFSMPSVYLHLPLTKKSNPFPDETVIEW